MSENSELRILSEEHQEELNPSSPTDAVVQHVIEKHFANPEIFTVAANVLPTATPVQSLTSHDEAASSAATQPGQFSRHGQALSSVSDALGSITANSARESVAEGSDSGSTFSSSVKPARVTALNVPTPEGGKVTITISAIVDDPVKPKVVIHTSTLPEGEDLHSEDSSATFKQHVSPSTAASVVAHKAPLTHEEDDDEDWDAPLVTTTKKQTISQPILLSPDEEDEADIAAVISKGVQKGDAAVLHSKSNSQKTIVDAFGKLQVGSMVFNGKSWVPGNDIKAREDQVMAAFDEIVNDAPIVVPVKPAPAPVKPAPAKQPVAPLQEEEDDEDWDAPATKTAAVASSNASQDASKEIAAEARKQAEALAAAKRAQGGGLKTITLEDMHSAEKPGLLTDTQQRVNTAVKNLADIEPQSRLLVASAVSKLRSLSSSPSSSSSHPLRSPFHITDQMREAFLHSETEHRKLASSWGSLSAFPAAAWISPMAGDRQVPLSASNGSISSPSTTDGGQPAGRFSYTLPSSTTNSHVSPLSSQVKVEKPAARTAPFAPVAPFVAQSNTRAAPITSSALPIRPSAISIVKRGMGAKGSTTQVSKTTTAAEAAASRTSLVTTPHAPPLRSTVAMRRPHMRSATTEEMSLARRAASGGMGHSRHSSVPVSRSLGLAAFVEDPVLLSMQAVNARLRRKGSTADAIINELRRMREHFAARIPTAADVT